MAEVSHGTRGVQPDCRKLPFVTVGGVHRRTGHQVRLRHQHVARLPAESRAEPVGRRHHGRVLGGRGDGGPGRHDGDSGRLARLGQGDGKALPVGEAVQHAEQRGQREAVAVGQTAEVSKIINRLTAIIYFRHAVISGLPNGNYKPISFN